MTAPSTVDAGSPTASTWNGRQFRQTGSIRARVAGAAVAAAAVGPGSPMIAISTTSPVAKVAATSHWANPVG